MIIWIGVHIKYFEWNILFIQTAEKEASTSESKVSMADLIKERDQVWIFYLTTIDTSASLLSIGLSHFINFFLSSEWE